jgi:protein SCO1
MSIIRQTAITVIGCLVFLTSVAAQSGHHDHKSAAAKPSKASTQLKRPGIVTIGKTQIPFTDIVVVDQDGRQKRFYSDLVKDKVVVLSFFFTRCVSICPSMNMALRRLQTNLGDLLGKEVVIVTVSKDPEYDTPEKLKEWSKAIGVKPGWTLVTGEVSALKKIIFDFTGDAPGPGSHSTVFMLGNDRTGEWLELMEFTSSEDLREHIDLLSKRSEFKL